MNSQTFSNTAIDSSGQIAALSQEPTNGSLSLSEAVAVLATGHLQSQETTIIPASQPVVMSDNNNSVNQAWFTTKEDKDNLHGKGNLSPSKKKSKCTCRLLCATSGWVFFSVISDFLLLLIDCFVDKKIFITLPRDTCKFKFFSQILIK